MTAREPRPCGRPATMVVYGHGPEAPRPTSGRPMCSRHGMMLVEDAGCTYALLRPRDPKARCEFQVEG